MLGLGFRASGSGFRVQGSIGVYRGVGGVPRECNLGVQRSRVGGLNFGCRV